MSLLNSASLCVTPNGYKAGTLYSVIPNTSLGDMNVVRATTATRVNSAGLIESVANNVPRLDYSNGTCPSILVEPQRTNISLYSQQFDNINWSKENSSITSNQLISPDGNLTADIITDNSTNDRHIIFEAFTGDFSTSRTFSTYAKQGSLRYLVLSITSINDSASCYSAIFDLQTGTITATKNNGTATITASIQNAGNGWYRCIISGTLGIGVLAYFPIIGTSNRATFTGSLVNNNIPVYVGSGQSLYIWGAQLEAGSYPTSYIPTTSAAVTRNADVISKTGISSLIGQTEGTLFFEGYFNDVQTGTVFLDLEGTSPKINLQIGSGILYFYSQGEWSMSTAISLNTKYKIAGAYKNNDIAFYVNGVLIATDNSATITAKSNFYLNSEGGSYVADLDINLAILFPTRLTNAELASLTTI